MNRFTATESRAVPAPFAPGAHLTIRRRRRRILTRAAESARSRVAAAFRSLANGVDARTAGARVNAFYRSSGFAWARCLG